MGIHMTTLVQRGGRILVEIGTGGLGSWELGKTRLDKRVADRQDLALALPKDIERVSAWIWCSVSFGAWFLLLSLCGFSTIRLI